MKDDYWIVRDDVGIKCFPRVGSSTILATYGFNQSREKFMQAPRKFVVVRNPFDRLLSAYALLFGKQYTDVPKLERLDDLLRYILLRKDHERDVHVRSMTGLLEGYEPADGEIIELNDFLSSPVLAINPAHVGLRKRVTLRSPPTGEISAELLGEYLEQYLPDTKLWKRATF